MDLKFISNGHGHNCDHVTISLLQKIVLFCKYLNIN